MRTLNGVEIHEIKRRYVLYANSLLHKMLEKINEASGLTLTEEHISFNVDQEDKRFFFYVKDELFTDEMWNKLAYDLDNAYETFDQILREIFCVPSENDWDLYHTLYDDTEEYIIVTFNEGLWENHMIKGDSND